MRTTRSSGASSWRGLAQFWLSAVEKTRFAANSDAMEYSCSFAFCFSFACAFHSSFKLDNLLPSRQAKMIMV